MTRESSLLNLTSHSLPWQPILAASRNDASEFCGLPVFFHAPRCEITGFLFQPEYPLPKRNLTCDDNVEEQTHSVMKTKKKYLIISFVFLTYEIFKAKVSIKLTTVQGSET